MAKTTTIDEALDAFLAEQRKRLSAKTLRNYEDVVLLLRSSLNGYAYQSLDGLEEERWRKALDAGDEEAFTRLFGPEKMIENLGEFLGYFMVRKVMASQELRRAGGFVVRRRNRSSARLEEGQRPCRGRLGREHRAGSAPRRVADRRARLR